MNAFISYSHQDEHMLSLFHKHFAQLQRDRLLTTWTDREIHAGGDIHQNISSALNNSEIFIAFLSPDYLASNYCYDKEFESALENQQQGIMIIIPIVLEPCDWLNTPFKDFKALPKDGKPVSTWENKNTAFLDIIQNIRKLIESPNEITIGATKSKTVFIPRNYRVQKDFDSIQKLEFAEKGFQELKDYIKRYIEEVQQLDNVKVRVLADNATSFDSILVNRNKIATESQLVISLASDNTGFGYRATEKTIRYSVSNNRISDKSFSLAFDAYHLFWAESNFYSMPKDKKELTSKDIAENIWNDWLESVGIL